MKTIKQVILIILYISVLFLPLSFANDYMKWDLPEGAKLRIGKGEVSNLTYSPDGTRLIVECDNGIWTYDAQTGVELSFISTYDRDILGVSPNGEMFVTVDIENRYHIRSMEDDSLISEIQGDTTHRRTAVISPDGNIFAAGIGKTIVLWDIVSGEKITTLTGHTGSVDSLAFSPDGNTLASGNWHDTVRLWDVATATQKKVLTNHRNSISKVIFSPDGSKVASISSNQNRVNISDVISDRNHPIQLEENISEIAFSPDGSTIAIGNRYGRLYLLNVETQEHITDFFGHKKESVYAIVFSPDGTKLASGSSDSLFTWDANSGERVLSINGHTTGIRAVAFSPVGDILATGGRYQINLWNTSSTERVGHFYVNDWYNLFSGLVFSPDGNILASQDGRETHIWDVNLQTHLALLTGIGGENLTSSAFFVGLDYSPDGQFLAGGSEYNTAVHIWYGGRTHIDAFFGHTAGVTSVKFSPDGRILASGSNDQTVRIWDVSTGYNISTFKGHTDRVHCVDFNDDGSILASCGKDNSIIFWDMSSGDSRVIHSAHRDEVRKIAFSKDGKYIMSCGGWDDSSVKVWYVNTGELVRTLNGHGYSVLDVAFSADGQTFASGSMDGTVLLWDYNSILDTKDIQEKSREDVNSDGVVDLQDLIYIALQFGKTGIENSADINNDGVVNIEDLLLVAAALENVNSAPRKFVDSNSILNPTKLQQWLTQSQMIPKKTPIQQKGITVLENIILMLAPDDTKLLPNYPNPANPETWIPYQLKTPSNVTIRIYTANGELVRKIEVGLQPAGIYHSRSRAAYWDGKNEYGERVASGNYFYTLSSGQFVATRKLLIRK